MEWLKKLLDKNGVPDEIQEIIVTEAKTENANYIPKARFDEVNNTLKDYKTQLSDRDKQLKDLGEKAKGNEDLTKQIEDLKTENARVATEADTNIRNMKIDTALKMALKENKAKYEDLLISKFDKDKIKVKEDGTIEGITEQLTGLKEGYKDLFEVSLAGNKPANSGGAPPAVNPMQADYDAAIKAGNMPLAVNIKNKMFETPPAQI